MVSSAIAVDFLGHLVQQVHRPALVRIWPPHAAGYSPNLPSLTSIFVHMALHSFFRRLKDHPPLLRVLCAAQPGSLGWVRVPPARLGWWDVRFWQP